MSELLVCIDVTILIAEYLSDKEKMMMTMTSTKMDTLKYKLIYKNKISIDKIKNLPYFDNFEYVEIFLQDRLCPRNVKYIYFRASTIDMPLPFIRTTLTENKVVGITHLEFGNYFNQPVKNAIPTSVTHLIFWGHFNQPLNGNIPVSVTHLRISRYFNQSIKDLSITHLILGTPPNSQLIGNIPASVSHIIFEDYFNGSIKNYIPSTVKYLKFGYYFRQSLDDIPLSVIEVTLNQKYDQQISEHILKRVKIIKTQQ